MVDLMTRRLAMGASSVIIAKGTAVGDGVNRLSFNVDFEPDMVSITNNIDIEQAGWVGLGRAVIVKGEMSAHVRHASTTATSGNGNSRALSPNNPWGEGVQRAGYDYATYEDGVFTMRNGSTVAQYCYEEGQTYYWTAVKYN